MAVAAPSVTWSGTSSTSADVLGGDQDQLAEAPGADARRTEPLAECLVTASAELALKAGDVMVDEDAPPRLGDDAVAGLASLDDHADRLMPKDDRARATGCTNL